MTVNNNHVGWEKILLICSSLIIPFVGLIVTVVIFGTRVDDRLINITQRQDKQDQFNNDFKTQLDTVKNRQERYHYESNGRFNDLEKKGK